MFGPTLTFEPVGRLGNLMFEYASLIGIAQKNQQTPLMPKSRWGHSVQSCFRPLSTRLDLEVRPEVFYRPSDLHFSNDAFHIPPNITTLKGQMQSWKYFDHVRYKIINEYRFNSQYLNRAQSTLRTLLQSVGRPLTFVGVQVRRTDFVDTWSTLINPVTSNYLKNAMNFFRRKHPNSYFVVTSDDIHWSKENIVSKSDVFFSVNQTACEDLALLANCNHSVISGGSSFGWWGAYLAGGDVTYYKGWLKHNAWYNLKFLEEDSYPPSWTALPRL